MAEAVREDQAGDEAGSHSHTGSPKVSATITLLRNSPETALKPQFVFGLLNCSVCNHLF